MHASGHPGIPWQVLSICMHHVTHIQDCTGQEQAWSASSSASVYHNQLVYDHYLSPVYACKVSPCPAHQLCMPSYHVTRLQQVRVPALHAILQCYTLLHVRVHVRVDARSCGSVRSVVSIPPPLAIAATGQPHDIRSIASQYCSG